MAAQDGLGTVVIVRVPRDGGVIARIRAELVANDWRVREIGPDAASSRATLPAVVMNLNARAALRMQPARGAIELFVASEGDAAGGGELVRLPAGEDDDGLLALRATEALRARGLRLPRREADAPVPVQPPAVGSGGEAPATARDPQPLPQPSAAGAGGTPTDVGSQRAEQERARKQAEAARLEREREVQAEREREARERAERERAEREAEEREAEEEAAEAEEAEEEELDEPELDLESNALRPSLLFVEVGPALGYSRGGTGASFAGFLNVRVQPWDDVSFNAFGFVPLAGGGAEYRGASATMRNYLVGGVLDLHGTVERFDLSAGAGGAFMVTTMEADVENMQFVRANAQTNYTGAALARVALHYTAMPRVRIGARLVFGLALPKISMKFGDDEAASWGQPFLLAAVTVDFGLPVLLRAR